jgi:outer membrane immunogenic protein
MKKLVLAASILAASAVSAFAADMPARIAKAPVVPPVVTYDWSGIYFGGAVGGAWHDTAGNFYNAPPGFFWSTSNGDGSLIYGGFAGIQKQWGNFVLGIEGGYNALDNGFNSTAGGGFGAACGFPIGQSCESSINNIWYIGGRVGYAWNRFMVYGQGGYAQADIDTQGFFNPAGPGFAFANATHGGWYAGVGAEYAVLDYLILGIDYKHYEFDSKQHNCNLALVSCVGPVNFRNVDADVDSVMARVSFKFNPWPTGPVVARY